MLKERVISALTLLSIFTIAFLMSEPWFFILLASIISIAALDELTHLLKLRGPEKIFYWFFSLATFVYFYRLNFIDIESILYVALFFWLLFVPLHLRHKFKLPIVAKVLFGSILILPLWIAVISLFTLNKPLLLFIFLSIFIADISAYFFGKKFGKHKLMKDVSPGKTIEGAIGAFFSNIIFSIILTLFFDTNIWVLIFASVLITLLSIVGDLYESLLKRVAGVKDSGKIIPGHGGVLDRIDGICSVIPVFAFLISYSHIVGVIF